MSKGEDKITKILESRRVRFEREKTFEDLRGGRLRYDFFIPKKKGGIIIEFNGAQHYTPVLKFHKNHAEFTAAQERDRRKISYALANNYEMYCIPFWDEELIQRYEDLFRPEYRVNSRWHNDITWRQHQNNS